MHAQNVLSEYAPSLSITSNALLDYTLRPKVSNFDHATNVIGEIEEDFDARRQMLETVELSRLDGGRVDVMLPQRKKTY